MADFDEVAGLLHVFKASHEHGEQFKHIRDAAYARLKAINDDHAPKPEEEVAPNPQEPPQEEDDTDHDDNDGRRV